MPIEKWNDMWNSYFRFVIQEGFSTTKKGVLRMIRLTCWFNFCGVQVTFQGLGHFQFDFHDNMAFHSTWLADVATAKLWDMTGVVITWYKDLLWIRQLFHTISRQIVLSFFQSSAWLIAAKTKKNNSSWINKKCCSRGSTGAFGIWAQPTATHRWSPGS